MSCVGDIAIIGFFFIGGTVFFEKQERTIGAIVSTPLRFWEYLAAKLTLLVLISLFVAVTVTTVADGFAYDPMALVVGVVLGTLVMLLVGFISSLPFASVSDWFLAATIPLRGAEPAGPALLRRVAEPGAVSHPYAGTAVPSRGRFRSGDLGAVASDLCGAVSGCVPGGFVLGGQGIVRPLRH